MILLFIPEQVLSVFGFYKGVRCILEEHAKEGRINTWPGKSFMFALTKKLNPGLPVLKLYH